jgi:hypothetical protein
VSRLYDRIRMRGTRPLTAGDVHALAASDPAAVRAALLAEYPSLQDLTPAELDDLASKGDRRARVELAKVQSSTPPLVMGIDALPDMPVVVADNVARYLASFGPGPTDVSDLVSVARPPFDAMWVDVQHASNNVGLYAWGVHFVVDEAGRVAAVDESGTHIGNRPGDKWIVNATIYVEWRKNDPVGPVATFVLPLNAEGRLHEIDTEGRGAIFGRAVEIPGVPEDAIYEASMAFNDPLVAGLLAISFMHCKNVDVREERPDKAVTRRRERRHGIPLTRYYVLDIAPMTTVLATEGDAATTGLRNALHICRGHFKTFSPEAPLFGRLTGTYWWAAQVRGDASQGTVEKDYRIRIADEGLGGVWEDLDEHVELAAAAESTGRDPDLAGRGLRAHNTTCNALAAAVRRAGHEPLPPKASEPQYDVAWDDGDAVWVAEVKSLTRKNEEHQLRIALGQVLRYQQLLDADTKQVRAVIATEIQPTDDKWLDLCAEKDVVLVWASALAQFLPPVD